MKVDVTVNGGWNGQTITNTASVSALDQNDADPSNDGDFVDICVNIIDPGGDLVSENFASNTNTSFIPKVEEVSDLYLYPNPTISNLSVSFNTLNEGEAYVNIVSITSKTIITEKLITREGQNNLSFELGQLCKGIYMVQI